MHKQSKVATALTAALCAVAFNVIPGVADEQAAKPPVELVDAQRVAPNFVGIDNWLNSAPLNITDLRGKVVLIDFWTYGCYNCVNTLPHVTRLYDTYKDKGFVVVGVHTPEFPFEKSIGNLQAPSSATASAIQLRRTMNTPRGTPIETNIGRPNTFSIRGEKLSSSTPAKASMMRWSG